MIILVRPIDDILPRDTCWDTNQTSCSIQIRFYYQKPSSLLRLLILLQWQTLCLNHFLNPYNTIIYLHNLRHHENPFLSISVSSTMEIIIRTFWGYWGGRENQPPWGANLHEEQPSAPIQALPWPLLYLASFALDRLACSPLSSPAQLDRSATAWKWTCIIFFFFLQIFTSSYLWFQKSELSFVVGITYLPHNLS